MTITAAGLAGGGVVDGGTSIARSVGSVTSGQCVIFGAVHLNLSGTDDPFVVGDLTQTAGSATISDIRLHGQAGGNFGGAGGNYGRAVVYSCLVTGSGTLTLTLAGQPTGTFLFAASEALNGSWDTAREEAVAAGGLNTADAISSISSGNVTTAGAGIIIGMMVLNDGVNQTITEDGAFTLVAESQNGSTSAMGSMIYRIVATGTTDAGDWTFNTTDGNAYCGAAAIAVALKEAAAAASLEQEGFRFGVDDGSETTHTWAAAQDANLSAPAGKQILAVNINATGATGAKLFKLQYRKVGTTDWLGVPVSD